MPETPTFLGKGGFGNLCTPYLNNLKGIVYLAVLNGEKVAVKEMNGDAIEASELEGMVQS